MHKYQKHVNALFFAAGLIMWILSKHYLEVAIIAWGLSRKLGGSVDAIQVLVPIFVAVGTFVLLRRNSFTLNFATDAINELAMVHWPTKKETQLGTVVVIVTVLLAGLVLGLIDISFMTLVKTIINI